MSSSARLAICGLVLSAICWLPLVVSQAKADLIGHGGMVRAIDVAPDGKLVLTGSFDFTARLWDFGTQTEVAVLDAHEGPVTSAIFFPDGKRAITTSDDMRAIIWDIGSGKPLLHLAGHAHKVMAAAVSRDNKRAATGAWDKTVRIWDADTGKILQVIEQSAPINDVVFVNGGNWIAAGGHDGKIAIWDVRDGRLQGILEGHRLGITKISVSPDGNRILSASIDRTLRLWDVTKLTELKSFNHSEDNRGQVYSATFSPDGHRALSAGRDGRLVLWDLDAGKIVRTIPAHAKIVWAVRFSPDGRFALSASSDENAAVWHLKTGDRIGLIGDEEEEPKPWLESTHPGAKLFSKCARCHALDAKANRRSGPHFGGLWGRKVGAIANYKYSGALKGKDFTWNEKTLFDLFDRGPDKYLPGTKMPVQTVSDKEQLTQLVDYLRVLTTSKDR